MNNSSWISIKDRLPKYGEEVLIYTEWNNIEVATLEPRKDNDNVWLSDVGIVPEEHHIGEVTHWMPLPEPPKEGGSKS